MGQCQQTLHSRCTSLSRHSRRQQCIYSTASGPQTFSGRRPCPGAQPCQASGPAAPTLWSQSPLHLQQPAIMPQRAALPNLSAGGTNPAKQVSLAPSAAGGHARVCSLARPQCRWHQSSGASLPCTFSRPWSYTGAEHLPVLRAGSTNPMEPVSHAPLADGGDALGHSLESCRPQSRRHLLILSQ